MSLFPAELATQRKPDGLEWNDLAVILAICRAGSLSGAARALRLNHSTVFRKLNSIEAKTRVRFFERLPDGYAMTDAGRTAMQYAERIEAEVHALGREVLGQDLRLQGRVTVTAMEGLAATTVPAMLAEFRRRHPEVVVELIGSVAALDLARREADLAIRATRKPPDTSLGRKVCDFRFAPFAAQKYLQDRADDALADHDWCFISGTVDWLVPMVWKKQAQADARRVFSSSLTMAVINASAEGMGVTLLPCYLGDANRRLVRVTDTIEPLTLELWVLTHPDLRHTARVKALRTHLYDALKKDADLFEGKRR